MIIGTNKSFMVKIVIKQHSISFGSQFKIFVNNKEEFYAETDAFSKSIINIYKIDELKPYFRILKSLFLNYPKFTIEIPNEDRFTLKSMSFGKLIIN